MHLPLTLGKLANVEASNCLTGRMPVLQAGVSPHSRVVPPGAVGRNSEPWLPVALSHSGPARAASSFHTTGFCPLLPALSACAPCPLSPRLLRENPSDCWQVFCDPLQWVAWLSPFRRPARRAGIAADDVVLAGFWSGYCSSDTIGRAKQPWYGIRCRGAVAAMDEHCRNAVRFGSLI